jgi:hypothetical protein
MSALIITLTNTSAGFYSSNPNTTSNSYYPKQYEHKVSPLSPSNIQAQIPGTKNPAIKAGF